MAAWAQTGGLKGKIVDQQTGETMIGVNVLVVGTSLGGVTDLDGNFALANVPAGQQSLKISYIGYQELMVPAAVKAGQTLDLGTISLQEESTGLEEVEIFADVVEDRKTPVAVSNIEAVEISEQLGGMQLPELLNSTPGVYATPGSGAFADAQINIRGFDQTEVLFMINGVPLNDMENGLMYWANFAGLSEITRNMQVQRGLGASKLAVNSVGGTMNIITKPADKKKGGRAETMFGNGSWDNRYRLTLNSGKMDGGWSFTFQGSRTTGKGYLEGAFADSWSYFLTAAKEVGTEHTLLFTLFGAPTNRGRVFSTSTAEYELRGSYFFNPAMGYYKGQQYNASQNYSHKPQATLMHLWNISDRLFLSTSVYASIARAYGVSPVRATGVGAAPTTTEGYQNFDFMYEANVANVQTINQPNGDPLAQPVRGAQALHILEARYNNHNWYGAISNLTFKINDQTSLVAGLDVRDYTATHYAEAFDLLGGEFWLDKESGSDRDLLTPNRVVRKGDRMNYDYDGNVRWGSMFAQIERTAGKFTIFGSTNVSRTQMWRTGNFWNGRSFNIENSFGPSDKRVFSNFNAKAGVSYRINGRHNVFVNGGYFTRAPYLRNAFEDSRYNNRYLRGLKSENILAAEAGYSYRSSRVRANVNVYHTQWADRAFSYFVTDPTSGDRIYFSVVGQEAVHRGIEADFQLDVIKDLQIRGMVSLGDWYWANNVNTTVVDDNGNNQGTVLVAAKDLPVGNTAQTTAFLGLHYKGVKDMYFGSRINFFDRLYEQYDPSAYQVSSLAEVENRRPVRQLPAYSMIDIYGGYYFKVGEQRARISFNVHNVLNQYFVRRADQRFGGENYGYGINYNVGLSLDF